MLERTRRKKALWGDKNTGTLLGENRMDNSIQKTNLGDNQNPPKMREMNRRSIMFQTTQITKFWLGKRKGIASNKQR
eukprot:12273667-Heterocapsa_arctica.AAC.1